MAHHEVNEHTTESTLIASRALLGIVARSMVAALHEVTLPQFRALVILSSAGPLRMGAIAERMGTHPSTLSRTVDRLVHGGWVERVINEDSRRETLILLSPKGRQLVDEVSEQRRAQLREILAELTPEAQEKLADAFDVFASAAGEPNSRDLLILGIG